MNGRYKAGDKVFGNWTLVKLIGEGSFGQVFEAEREDFGRVYKAAIKIITIPQSQSEIQSIRADGLDDESVTAYLRGFVEELVDEFALMSQLKGHSNIVSYEDHMVQAHTETVGWDIMIRMELLTPLLQYVRENTMTQRDVIKLGIDMCKALELCQKYKIVHRDIKPENIFVSPAGDYKLGDFGIARTVEKTTSGLSKKGTYTYMAPEIYLGQPYGTTVDIYSLGIVLYWLLNESRSPFLPPYPAPITHSDRENALRTRMCGAPIPAPKNADGRLAEIVLNACAYDPKDRYSSPMQMRQELMGILYDPKEAAIIFPEGDEVPARSLREISTDEPTELLCAEDAEGSREGIYTEEADSETRESFLETEPTDEALLDGTATVDEFASGTFDEGGVKRDIGGREEAMGRGAHESYQKIPAYILWIFGLTVVLLAAMGILSNMSTFDNHSPEDTAFDPDVMEWLVAETVEYDGHRYKVYDEGLSWDDAKTACEALGGHLAVITSVDEEGLVEELVQSGEKIFYWLGGTDSTQEGRWAWITEEPWEYTKWDDGEPNNSGMDGIEENYLTITRGKCAWNDAQGNGDSSGGWSTQNAGYICEWENFSEPG